MGTYLGVGTCPRSFQYCLACIVHQLYTIATFNNIEILLVPAEDNWRNDYPDEEDLFHSDSEEEGQHSRAAYRYHDSYGMIWCCGYNDPALSINFENVQIHIIIIIKWHCIFIVDDYIFDEAHDDPYQQNTSYW